MDTLGRLSAILQRRQLSGLSVCIPVHQALFEKGSTLKGKNLLPGGCKFFPFSVITFSEWRQNNFDTVASPESLSVLPKIDMVLGPVVQSVVILTSLLRVILLIVLADSIHNILIFFSEKM